MRPASQAEPLFSTVPFAESELSEPIYEANDAFSSEDRAQVAVAAAQLESDLGLSRIDSRSIANLVTEQLHEPADTRTQGQWLREAEANLKARHGEGWQSALAEAKALVASDPRLRNVLARTGLGNHPLVVDTLVTAARRLRGRG